VWSVNLVNSGTIPSDAPMFTQTNFWGAKRGIGTGSAMATDDSKPTKSARGTVDKCFFIRATRRIEKLLECSATTRSLRIESLAAGERRHLMRSLRRLSRYGDRVTVRMSTSVSAVLPVDWSAFQRDLDEV